MAHILATAKPTVVRKGPEHVITGGLKQIGVPQGGATSCSLSTVNLWELLNARSKESSGYADDGL